jgi:hypothetical protein
MGDADLPALSISGGETSRGIRVGITTLSPHMRRFMHVGDSDMVAAVGDTGVVDAWAMAAWNCCPLFSPPPKKK